MPSYKAYAYFEPLEAPLGLIGLVVMPYMIKGVIETFWIKISS